MSEADKAFFPVDYKSFNWHRYTKTYAHGLRTYLLKESPDLTAAKAKYEKIKLAHYCLKTVFYLIVFGLFIVTVTSLNNSYTKFKINN